MMSDSELEKNSRRMFENTTVFSDCDENLPSVRAHLAASRQYRESKLTPSSRSYKETTPLLDDDSLKREVDGELPRGFKESTQKTDGYETLGGSVKRKKNKWDIAKKWYIVCIACT